MAKKAARRKPRPTVLVIDIGGSRVKAMTSTERVRRAFASGPTLSAKVMVRKVKALTKDWSYDVVAIGYPGPVANNRPLSDPHNLGRGWAGFNFEKAFGRRPLTAGERDWEAHDDPLDVVLGDERPEPVVELSNGDHVERLGDDS